MKIDEGKSHGNEVSEAFSFPSTVVMTQNTKKEGHEQGIRTHLLFLVQQKLLDNGRKCL